MQKRLQTAYTIRTLLEEVKKTLPSFKEGQVFETLKPIYPTDKIPRTKKNIKIKNKVFTKPLAVDKKTKKNFIKQNSPLKKFFREFSRGDFLRVIKTDGTKAYCINESLKPSIRKKYYKELIEIDYNNLLNGDVKLYRRKLTKYFKEE